MATPKNTTLTFRSEPDLKDTERTAGELEHGSIANNGEIAIRDHRGQVDAMIQEPRDSVKSNK